ncbi:glycoside hydrolase [Podospora australis]|uniref:Glycoside hydrolase n=1 Tax=Podospora australis TaxID=1536484 RepID=A0AAN7AFL7_9PEZI|nr:glycoside hydrolase [Podospora australis]
MISSPLTFGILYLTLTLTMGTAHAAVQGVFAHYMVGGMSNKSQAHLDISSAQSLGLDAFALNIQNPSAPWTKTTLQFLFSTAAELGFKLFFVADMAVISSPKDFLPLYRQYATNHSAYYHFAGKPFLSTFSGGHHPPSSWGRLVPTPFFVPNFREESYSASFFSARDDGTQIDGIASWETAWPWSGPDNSSLVSSDIDTDNLKMARAKGKVYMMPVSTFQSKHSPEHGNWFRRGGTNLVLRMEQALELKPDFVQLLSWNDAGEGHYFGNIWPESLGGSELARELVEWYEHTAWQVLLRPFVKALKDGTRENITEGTVKGAFWYRPLLKNVTFVGRDKYGLEPPDNWEDAEDAVNIGLLVGGLDEKVKIRVWSGGDLIKEIEAREGMSAYQVDGIRKGVQVVQVVSNDGRRVMAEGRGLVGVTDDITDLNGVWNFNYQVVEIAERG